MNVAYLGNFDVDFTTETHVADALESNGHHVRRLPEGRTPWADLPPADCDLFLWTTTYSNAPQNTYRAQQAMLDRARTAGIRTAAFHLDLWWGLERAHRVPTAPFFRCDHVFTADGSHPQDWERERINHRWFPPAVAAAECVAGTPQPRYRTDIVFVGSWQGGYHPESSHREALIQFLQRNYPRACTFWPRPGEHAIRGRELRDLYASATVVVGDSCLVGHDIHHYISDRVPETVGRAGYLLHPTVEGVTDGTLYQPGEHLGVWEPWDWDGLDEQISWALHNPEAAQTIGRQGQQHVREHHTYTVRMAEMVTQIEQVTV